MSRDDLIRQITVLEKRLDDLVQPELSLPHFLSAPLTSVAWDGDSFSTTAKTVIDLSGVFSAPAGIRAALFKVQIRDSDSANNPAWFLLSPNDTAAQGFAVMCPEVADRYAHACIVVPCDSSGDVYYQCQATGASTLDVTLEIWGYWL